MRMRLGARGFGHFTGKRPFRLPLRSFVSSHHGHAEDTTGHRVWSAGEGMLGCLALDGSVRDQFTPMPMESLEELEGHFGRPVQVSCGWAHSAVVTERGQVLLWGRTHDMRSVMSLAQMQNRAPWFTGAMQWAGLSSGADNVGSVFPQHLLMPFLDEDAEEGSDAERDLAVSVVCGAGVTAVVGKSGRLYMTGMNQHGQCGQGHTHPRVWGLQRVKGLPLDRHLDLSMDKEQDVSLGMVDPRTFRDPSVDDGRELQVVEVALGFNHALARTRGGEVYSWGKGERGQLGLELSKLVADVENLEASGKQLKAAKVTMPWELLPSDALQAPPRLQKVVRIAAGFAHTACATDAGEAYVWGKFMGDRQHHVEDGELEGGGGEGGRGEGAAPAPDQRSPRRVHCSSSSSSSSSDSSSSSGGSSSGNRPLEGVVDIASSAYHITLKDSSGALYMMGVRGPEQQELWQARADAAGAAGAGSEGDDLSLGLRRRGDMVSVAAERVAEADGSAWETGMGAGASFVLLPGFEDSVALCTSGASKGTLFAWDWAMESRHFEYQLEEGAKGAAVGWRHALLLGD